MSEATWTRVDEYVESVLFDDDDALAHARSASAAGGLPAIEVTATQGRLLQTLARAVAATRILEVGTLGGYSAIWLARCLPEDGVMITLELEEAHATVARANLAYAGLDGLVEVRVGSAKDSLSRLIDSGAEAFDLIFIDADKESNPAYFASALRLSHAGTLIVVDNVVRSGALADEDSPDGRVRATRAMLELASTDPRVEGTVIQTVGAKGYDGFALFRVA